MKIGLTYDLRQDYLDLGHGPEQTAELDKWETIESLAQALQELGHEPIPIGNARNLVSALARQEGWDLVFNIAEGLTGFGREALVPALLEAYGIPYTFSDPLTLSVALHKGLCKRVVRDTGIPTADFEVVERPEQIDEVNLPFPLFVKPVAEGTGKGISQASVAHDDRQLRIATVELLFRFQQPVLVETYLPGREFTVGIVGTGQAARSVGVLEVTFNDPALPVYSYTNKEDYRRQVEYHLVQGDGEGPVEEVALRSWRALGCRDGGRVDVRLDGRGRPMFMEVNPLAGLNPVDSDLPILCKLVGWSYLRLIQAILESAQERIPGARCRAA